MSIFFLTVGSLFEFEISNFSEKYFYKNMKVKIVDSIGINFKYEKSK